MKRVLQLSAVCLVMMGGPALAHHPFAAEYDWKKPVTINGTVTRFDWRNPHAYIELQGRDQNGQRGQWTAELGSPSQLQRMGWRPKQLKAGDHITVEGWLAKNGSQKLSAKSVTTVERELAAASSFFDAKNQSASVARPSGTKGTSGRRVPIITGQ